MIRPLPTSSFGHLATGEQQSRQPPSPINLPIPTPNVRTTKITAHPLKSHDSPVADFILWTLGNGRTTVPTTPQSRQHSLPTRPTSPPKKSQPIHPNPKNHSPVQTLRISRFLTNTSISGTIFNGITVSSLALTLTRIVTSLVGPSAAQTSAASQVARVHFRPLPRLPANPTSQPYIPGFPPGLAKAPSP